ncbi:MAG TPA: VTT domain-containing protein [Anaerohalosphaeraceae bacterium]|jgi:membrane protein YqaA with SNARE-associated domain|nr:VTT domain-containing protein [Anaerohalosphaeraceae bacterium]HRT49479.1 VTT domain-containing protein [Anaerohalosphaeraceae bacterium]HRT85357.1 VTT domain-containing protein [Anaerohalosphaeraceae bacterium]
MNKPDVPHFPWWHWHRHLYNWVIHFAETPHGTTALSCLSFAESSFFPVPPDVLLAPLTLGAPKKWFSFALACSVASVLGGAFGYAVGAFLWDQVGDWVFANLGSIGFTPENFQTFQNYYDRYDFWIVFTCGFTPLPYKVCTISAGVAGISFPGFLIASALSRSARFFLVAGLFGWKGERIRPVVEKYFNWLSLLFVILLIAGFAALKLLH